jgi:riboflavin kinase/FMN adenylyltransferase
MVKKLKLYKNFSILNKHKNSILLIGNFDGLHIGHQKLFKLAKEYKSKFKIKIGVLTFDPIPKMFFNKKLKNFKIFNLNQKINYLKKFKIDFIIIKKFDKKFSKIKYLNFINHVLFKKLKPKNIFVSNNFRFGNK